MTLTAATIDPQKGRRRSGLFVPRFKRWRPIAIAIVVSLLAHGLLAWSASRATIRLPASELRASNTSRQDGAVFRIVLAGRQRAGHVEARGEGAQEGGAKAAVDGQAVSLAPRETVLALGRYYRLADVDVRPQIREQIEPEFPPHLNPGTRGTVRVRLFIDEAGRVEEVVILDAEPSGLFEAAAIEAFKRATYTPALRGKTAVPVYLTLEVTFESGGRQ